jgi:hypothetical protein
MSSSTIEPFNNLVKKGGPVKPVEEICLLRYVGISQYTEEVHHKIVLLVLNVERRYV